MGWKSTIDITRTEAKQLIVNRMLHLGAMSDRELANLVEELGYGDNPDLIYYGRNFMVTD
tara:strand:- start:241 stop:420 length:180 start_codon:yes stop_codon:yes gene_type:complete